MVPLCTPLSEGLSPGPPGACPFPLPCSGQGPQSLSCWDSEWCSHSKGPPASLSGVCQVHWAQPPLPHTRDIRSKGCSGRPPTIL